MTIFEQIRNSRKSTEGFLYQVSKEDYNQIRGDYNYDEQRVPIHPMQQFYRDNYGRQFNYEKYIECVLNYQLNEDYEYKVIINDQFKDPTIIKVFIVVRVCS
jgi:Iap family predicted aminopeptidase